MLHNNIKPIKIHYGLTKKFKGRHFDIALQHIKYVYAIEYPENFFINISGKFGEIKANNIKVFKRLKVIYKLKFDRKSQWLTKFNHIYTIKSSLRSCKEFRFIGLNLLKYAKQVKTFVYHFPYRVSFDKNRIKDINCLKYIRDLKVLSINVDAFDTKAMYDKLFKILKGMNRMELLQLVKVNLNLIKPYFDVLERIKRIAIVSDIQLELNDFVFSSEPKDGKSIELFEKIQQLQYLEDLILELNLTMKTHTNAFFLHFKAPSSLRRLELNFMNLSFSYDSKEAESQLRNSLENFYKELESPQHLSYLKLWLNVDDNFNFVNDFIEHLPYSLDSLETADCIFRTANEIGNSVRLDKFWRWITQLKRIKDVVLRTNNLIVDDDEILKDIDLPHLRYLRLTEEFGRKPAHSYQGVSKANVNWLCFLQNQKRLEKVDFYLNFSDLSENFSEVLFTLLNNLPVSLRAFRLRITHRDDRVISIDSTKMQTQIVEWVERFRNLRFLDLCILSVTFQALISINILLCQAYTKTDSPELFIIGRQLFLYSLCQL